MLREVIYRFPAAGLLLLQAYSQPSPNHLGSIRLWSSRGFQIGNPLDPILFALSVDGAIRTLRSLLNLWFLDDSSLTGSREPISMTANIGRHAALFFLARFAVVPRAMYLCELPQYTHQWSS